jgi:serine protease AprX
MVAPGTHITSLRAAGSYIDQTYGSTGGINDRFMRGSGTSEAAAITSGAAALLLEKKPTLTPDQVKKTLMTATNKLPGQDAQAQGAGLINVTKMIGAPTPPYVQ